MNDIMENTQEKEIDRFLEVFPNVVSKLRAMSPLYDAKE